MSDCRSLEGSSCTLGRRDGRRDGGDDGGSEGPLLGWASPPGGSSPTKSATIVASVSSRRGKGGGSSASASTVALWWTLSPSSSDGDCTSASGRVGGVEEGIGASGRASGGGGAFRASAPVAVTATSAGGICPLRIRSVMLARLPCLRRRWTYRPPPPTIHSLPHIASPLAFPRSSTPRTRRHTVVVPRRAGNRLTSEGIDDTRWLHFSRAIRSIRSGQSAHPARDSGKADAHIAHTYRVREAASISPRARRSSGIFPSLLAIRERQAEGCGCVCVVRSWCPAKCGRSRQARR